MKHLLFAATVVAALFGAAALASPASAGVCSPVSQAELNAPYSFRYGLTGDELQKDFFSDSGLKGDGYRPKRLTGYLAGTSQRFATKWLKAGGPAWSSRFGLRGDAYAGPQKKFHTYFLEMKAAGYRPIDVSGYNTSSGDVRYAAVFERNTAGVTWRIHRDVSRNGMQALVDTYEWTGFVPFRVEGYRLGGDLRFISIWVKEACGWKMHNRMTREQYQQRFDGYKQQYRLVHLDSYRDGNDLRFAGIWLKQPGPGQVVRSNRDWYLFQRNFNNLGCTGYVLDNAYATDTAANGVRYGGIWTFRSTPNIGPASPLRDQIRKQVDCAPGRAGAAVINATTGESTFVHADQQFGTSSTIKSGILKALLRRIDTDAGLTLNSMLNVGAQFGSNPNLPNIVEVPVQEATCATSPTDLLLQANTSYSLRCLAQLMIRVSHNWATNRLVELVGPAQINAQLSDMGMTRTRLGRYMTGPGVPSLHGLANETDDYEAGWDSLSSPRDMATFMQRMHVDGLIAPGNPFKLLSQTSFDFFWATLGLDSNGGTNTKSFFPAFLGNIAGWTNVVTVANKAGTNAWTGAPGTFDAEPQLGSHLQASEAGRLLFSNGQVVYYAMFVDEADSPAASVDEQDAVMCTGLAVVAVYGGVAPGGIPAVCN